MKFVGIVVCGIALAPTTALAEKLQTVPANTIDCSAFKVSGDTIQVVKPTTFDVGTAKALSMSNLTISRRIVAVDGLDLFDIIDTKCGR